MPIQKKRCYIWVREWHRLWILTRPGKFRTYSEPDFLEAGSPRLFRVSQFPSEPRSEYISLTRISFFFRIGAILFDPGAIAWLETAQEIQLEIRWLNLHNTSPKSIQFMGFEVFLIGSDSIRWIPMPIPSFQIVFPWLVTWTPIDSQLNLVQSIIQK